MMEFVRYSTETFNHFLAVCSLILLLTFCISWLIMMIRDSICKILKAKSYDLKKSMEKIAETHKM